MAVVSLIGRKSPEAWKQHDDVGTCHEFAATITAARCGSGFEEPRIRRLRYLQISLTVPYHEPAGYPRFYRWGQPVHVTVACFTIVAVM